MQVRDRFLQHRAVVRDPRDFERPLGVLRRVDGRGVLRLQVPLGRNAPCKVRGDDGVDGDDDVVEGTILAADGRPAVGADVRIIGDVVDAGCSSISLGREVAHTTTDESGRYRVEALEPLHVEVIARIGDDVSDLSVLPKAFAEITSENASDPRLLLRPRFGSGG